MLGYIAAAIGIAMIAKTVWMVDDWSRDWTSNHAVLTMNHADESLHPITTELPIADVEHAVLRWANQASNWSIVSESVITESTASQAPRESTDSLRRLHLTHSTSVLRFVDDVRVEIRNESGEIGSPRTVLHAESQSRVGKGDLGQNPRNLKELRRGVLAELARGTQ